jgi:hypothetical protein
MTEPSSKIGEPDAKVRLIEELQRRVELVVAAFGDGMAYEGAEALRKLDRDRAVALANLLRRREANLRGSMRPCAPRPTPNRCNPIST